MKPATLQTARQDGERRPREAFIGSASLSQMTWDEAREIGLKRLKLNFVVVGVVGAVLLSVASGVVHGAGRFWLGFSVGLIYANCFEYLYHRYLLHGFHNSLAVGHAGHHGHWGRDDEPAHVGFGTSPFWVMAVLIANSLPFLIADYLWRWGLVVGVVAAFHLYFVLLESVHWQIHVGELPRFLVWCRQYHFAHHAAGDSKFNVFLPLFDLLLGTYRLPARFRQRKARPSSARAPSKEFGPLREMDLERHSKAA